jgi:hypothetical protein
LTAPAAGAEGRNSIADSLTQKKSLKLLKIELRKFSGKVKEWLGFCSEFRCIHDDPEIEKEDKFQYVIQAMMEARLMTLPATSCDCEADLKEKNY